MKLRIQKTGILAALTLLLAPGHAFADDQPEAREPSTRRPQPLFVAQGADQNSPDVRRPELTRLVEIPLLAKAVRFQLEYESLGRRPIDGLIVERVAQVDERTAQDSWMDRACTY